MRIGIIGAGKVGTTLGKYLSIHGKNVTGFYSRTHESADEAATFAETETYSSLCKLVEKSDVIFITTPDGVIHQVWGDLLHQDISNRIICHFSGSLSSHVFSGREEAGASGISMHPMYAFSDKFHSYEQFHTAYLTLEGDPEAVAVMKPMWEAIGHHVLTLKAEDKIKYHAAAAMASNEMLGLMQASLDILSECGFSEKDSMALLTPLVQGNIASMLEKGCVNALTGPVERGDAQTVRKHLQALEGSKAGKIYQSLGSTMVELAKRRNPDRDYTPVRTLFEKSMD
ncbi:DUF2520 domain-containing protein [Clostridium sp. OM07-10AC]|jgi:predicted short-subunit dehydrogenase-like oxidoreductase (DUF2520 family)|uniref:Rossmann-like and DUF2520 domain-containing protein n=1 Tax=Jutongia sp. TaxID=2944204 RepID=UPI0003403E5A|nr:DUF2520 domain-containing protein [Clostridium sp.]RHU98296.1 DUF2520 domain-containing protein [Clostridium sp. OM07-9AC]RHV07504.1 DUF2520 domain-containing protein [Clostridium sp. OM07-10AC]CDE69370.1 uncharacterized protein BN584_00796 [Clostridium sp. CAG:277]